jgi:DNA-binding transcriptional ArsR family regulator
MELDELANCLEKLGNPTRLAIFRLLVKAGIDGLPVGELQSRLGVPPSTLSHHILFLVTARLIVQERNGRVLQCKPNFARMDAIIEALTAECCAGFESRVPATRSKRRRRSAGR